MSTISATILSLFALITIKNSESYVLQNVPDGRIVGGVFTTIQQFPHQISLRYQNRHRCGGSIVSENVVLTAAHCVIGVNKNQMIVRAGTTYKDNAGTDMKISRIIIHERYHSTQHDNDIAIVFLAGNLKFSPKIQAITLDDDNSKNGRIAAGTTAFVSGWGALREDGFTSIALNYVSVLIVDQATCKTAYSSKAITDGMLCAGMSGGGRDSCQGDSGGPLVIYDKNVPKLVGIVSWGNGCARPKYPGVYAKVAAYRDWINKNANV